ncbi:c-type cytochrome [Hydrogenivirga caldilitoris]|nr:cytochrome c [Hydrogenivirga caldilitoris]
MNILIYLFLLLVSFSFPQEISKQDLEKGYEVYKNNCSICHMEQATLWDFLKARLNVLNGQKPENIDAPPMNLVSARIKEFYPTELEFVQFVNDYITHPSRVKGVCKPAAYLFFGTMPPIGQGMSEEEREAVAKWMYYRYSDVWDDFFKRVKELQRRVQSEKRSLP